MAADGEAYNRFAVCDEMSPNGSGEYIAKFSIYELDIMEYWDNDESVAKTYFVVCLCGALDCDAEKFALFGSF